MLKKLIKYDMKSMVRVFAPLWLLAPILALLFSFSIRGLVEASYGQNGFWTDLVESRGGQILMMVTGLLFVSVVIAMFVVTLILVIQRFWNGLLKEEGYLMFTLPVRTWQLITAKGITATIVNLISGLVAVISALLLFAGASRFALRNAFWAMGEMWDRILQELGGFTTPIILLLILLILVDTASGVYILYASMALGQLFEGHRVAGSFVSYVGINVVASVAASAGGILLNLAVPQSLLDVLESSSGFFLTVFLLALLLFAAVQIAVCHLVTEYVLTRRLNLE
ncbi:MAG: hypothetical protein Q4C82_00125 [Eubacteriales bacterium]|nr:hypothetical protein [Eubacteriales bacterium]